MKKNITLFTLLLVGLGTVLSTMPKKGGHHGGHHRRHRGGWGRRGGIGFGIGFGTGYGGYYGRPYGYGPYYGGYGPRTVVIEKPVQAAPSFSFWNITNNTNRNLNVTTGADEAFIRPGQTVSVNRGNSFNLRINGKRRTAYNQNIEVNY